MTGEAETVNILRVLRWQSPKRAPREAGPLAIGASRCTSFFDFLNNLIHPAALLLMWGVLFCFVF